MRMLDFGIANPDLSPPRELITNLQENVACCEWHRYPPDEVQGTTEFRTAVAEWFASHYRVNLDDASQVLLMQGTKEGALYLILALTQPGDIVVIAEPCYPAYRNIAARLGRRLHSIPLLPERDFIPDLSAVPRHIWQQSSLWLLNFPTNPTGTLAAAEWVADLGRKAEIHGFTVCNDFTYGQLYFGDVPPLSFLKLLPAGSRVVELVSFSKSLLIAGWRIGAMLGNPQVLKEVREIKKCSQAGVFLPMQKAVADFLPLSDPSIEQVRHEYARRAHLVVDELRQLGFSVQAPAAGMFVWARALQGSAAGFCRKMEEQWHVKFVSGSQFGEPDDQYFRISLTLAEAEITEMLKRMERAVYENSYV